MAKTKVNKDLEKYGIVSSDIVHMSDEEVKNIQDNIVNLDTAVVDETSSVNLNNPVTATGGFPGALFTSFEEREEVELVPSYNSPEWEPYVMSKFTESELADGKYPKLPGMRRVAGLLLGDIISSKPVKVDLVQLPDAPGRATVVYSIAIAWKQGLSVATAELVDSDVREFCAIGGSWHGNTDDTFAVFPEAIAEARAEARAYRKALRLSVVSADELTRKDTAEIVRSTVEKTVVPLTDDNKKISGNQISVITNLCSKLGIDLTKFINMGSKQYSSLTDVSSDTASKMISKLVRYQSNGADSEEIPLNIRVS